MSYDLVHIGTPQFSFIPSPNITILQSAVYQCTVTDVTQSDTVSIQWRVNGTSSTSDSWQSYLTNTGITVIGVDTLNSTLTIPGDPALNETTVTCLLSGYVNDVLYGDSDSAILYIQGCYNNYHNLCYNNSIILFHSLVFNLIKINVH